MNLEKEISTYIDSVNSGTKKADKHFDSFLSAVSSDIKYRFPKCNILSKSKAKVDGKIIKSKRWDLLVRHNHQVTAIETKSILSSKFGNNFNARVEEAIGVAYDMKSHNKNVRLAYCIILQNNDNAINKEKITKLKTFLTEIEANKLYKVTLGILINNDKSYQMIHNSYDYFLEQICCNNAIFYQNIKKFFGPIVKRI